MSRSRPLRIAWFSFFPVEWLPEVPEPVARLPKLHPASWQRVLVDELKARADLELHVISLRKELPGDISFSWEGIHCHCLKVPGGLRAPSLFWLDTWLIRRKLARIRPDLVHAWGTEQAAALVASRLKYPYLVTMQGLLNWIAKHVPLNRYERFVARLERVSLRRARLVTTEASFSRNYLKNQYPHLEVVQAEHAPNWLFHRARRTADPGRVRFLFVGKFCELKGADLLIQAMDRLGASLDFTLSLVGSGADFLGQLRKATAPQLWQQITIQDGLTPDAVVREMEQSTLMVFPTRADTSPNSVKEAVVAGLPVVASAIGGIQDYVLPGENGLTVKPGSLEELVNGIDNALRHPLLGKGLVRQDTLARLRQYLSPQTMADNFFKAYVRTLELWGGTVKTVKK